MSVYMHVSIYFSLLRFSLVSFCFLFLLVFSFCSPFLLLSVPFSFLSLCGFPSLSVSSFLPPSSSSFPFHLFLLALSSFPVFVFLLPRFFSLLLLILSFFWLPRLPFPPTLLCSSPSFFSFLLLLFLPSFLPLFSPIVRSYYFLLLLCLFSSSFFFWFFSYFFSSSFPPLSPVSSFPSVIISCLFLRLAYSSSLTPPPFIFLFLFSFSLGLVSLSVISCSFFRFPFACFCVLELCGLVFRFFLLPFSFFIFACFYVLPVCQSFFVSLGFSLPFSPSASLLR